MGAYRKLGTAAAVLVVCATGINAGSAVAQVSFSDVSLACGIEDGTTYFSPNIHSLGPMWIDFNNDGYADLFEVGGDVGRPPRLWQNLGNGNFSDVTSLLGTVPNVEMSGSVYADYDNDGDSDIYIYTDNPILDTTGDGSSNPADGPANLLLKNLWVESGQELPDSGPLFEEVAALVGVDDLAEVPFGALPGYRSKAASFMDLDRDGCVDLWVGHWVMRRGGHAGNKDRLYKNTCKGTFEDVTASYGLDDGLDPTNWRATLAGMGGHFDNDLWPDIYAVTGTNNPQPWPNDQFYQNDGTGMVAAQFIEPTDLGDDAQAGMGIDVADVDLDGNWDLYITDLRSTTHDELPKGNVIYKGDGAGSFFDNSIIADGVQGHNSWGTNFFDIDQDGWEDLFVGSMATAPASFVYMNDQDGTFTDVFATSGMSFTNVRGSAMADYDWDGDGDLAVVNQSGPLQVFQNNTTGQGNWLTIRPIATISNLDAIGTVIKATVGGVTRMRQIKSGSSGHGQDSNVAHFGFGAATAIDEVKVYWPSGLVDTLTDVATNAPINVTEGSTTTHFWWGAEVGGGDYYEADGVFGVDLAYSSGGSGYSGGQKDVFDWQIAGTTDDVLYNSMRTGDLFTYQFDNLPVADYEIELLFAEPFFNNPGNRVMDISVDGVLMLDDYDITAVTGARRIAHDEHLVTHVDDGSVEVEFDVVVSLQALVSGVRLRRLQFVMNAAGPLDEEANVGYLVADSGYAGTSFGYAGGRAFNLGFAVAGTADDEVYNTMRAGRKFSYKLADIPDGTYEVVLLLTEPYKTAAGQRTFDITLEGTLVRDDFDVFAAAGGRLIAHQETLTTTVTDGVLNLDFSVVRGRKAILSGLSIRRTGDVPASSPMLATR